MTKDDILNMPAGRDIDAMIHHIVLGNEIEKTVWVEDPSEYYYSSKKEIKQYSENIAAAWLVVEKINLMICENILEIENDYNYLTLECVGFTTGYAASFDCLLDHEWFEDITNYKYAARADTAPLAICRAALLAVMDGVQ